MKRLLALIAGVVLLCSCTGKPSGKQIDQADTNITRVLYFHGKKRCVSCNAIEKLTKEVVDSLADPDIEMSVVDITEQEEVAEKYQVAWSSLILDKAGRVEDLTQMGFSYAKNQPEVFKSKLIESITNINE